MSLVRLKGVTFSYHLEGASSVPVLKGIDFKVEKGDFIAIQGPSGSGKSTFLYLLSGLLKPSGGEVELFGHRADTLTDEALAEIRNRRIGFIFQQFHLLPRLSVLDNILLPAHYPIETSHATEADRKKAIELATKLGLGSRLDHKPNQLSGGQQQRVAIARALMRDPELLLADEPTGNLDSVSSAAIMEILRGLHAQGRSIVLITHDNEIARQAPRVARILDGQWVDDTGAIARADVGEVTRPAARPKSGESLRTGWWQRKVRSLQLAFQMLPLAIDNLRRNRTRSALTMLGITIGISAVLSLITLGRFTQAKVLDSYAELGVNTLQIYGYRNWRLSAKDNVIIPFDAFDWNRDLVPLLRIFPELRRITPFARDWGSTTASFGGRSVDQDVRIIGVNEQALSIMHRPVISGAPFQAYHVENRSNVCLIGVDLVTKLFERISPIGKVLYISKDDTTYGCKVMGVLDRASSANDWVKPNSQIIVPHTFLMAMQSRGWSRDGINDVLLEVNPNGDIERTGLAVKAFFERKYGKAGEFMVSSNSKLIGQMKRFLSLFTLFLAAIAFVCLGIGGIGIANMMLVSVSERIREIGLRKALGATHRSIRYQFLVESVFLCLVAGLTGVVLGFGAYQLAIYGASFLIKKVEFEWVLDVQAVALSVASILGVGVASGMIPAVRAEKLQVIEALRSE